MTIIPAIDLRGGRCVRLLRGDFARETTYSDDPVLLARRYRDSGLERLHVVDLDGARTGTQAHQALLERIVAELDVDIQLGGGIRDRETLAGWLRAGVARCVIGSTAVSDRKSVADWLAEFGAESIVLAMDVRTEERSEPRLATDGWLCASETTLWEAMEFYAAAGVRHVLCTDVGQDGSMMGANIALYAEFLRRYPDVALQGSGGVRNLDDLRELRDVGCAAAITGRALLDSAITLDEVTTFLRGA